MSGAHTPGPWVSVQAECGNIYAMTNTSNDYIRVDTGNPANALLIAAAPKLLAALQGVLRVADRATDEFDEARAAIAEALGLQGES